MDEKMAYLYDAAGELLAVQIPAPLWRRLEPLLQDIAHESLDGQDDMEAFAGFMAAWTFPYPYSPAVVCPVCKAATADWQRDPARPFMLKNANIGGLLVFGCRKCGATIRQKYFKTHMDCDFDAA